MCVQSFFNVFIEYVCIQYVGIVCIQCVSIQCESKPAIVAKWWGFHLF